MSVEGKSFVLSDAAVKEYDHLLEDLFFRMLLRGLHWFAVSQTQVERENELLNLITCLETFLSDGKSITNAVAVNAAHLLATGLEARLEIKRKLQGLYSVRSGVSHGGQKAILEQELAE
jgi:hypothetical protein